VDLTTTVPTVQPEDTSTTDHVLKFAQMEPSPKKTTELAQIVTELVPLVTTVLKPDV
jgi:hypothetical protein